MNDPYAELRRRASNIIRPLMNEMERRFWEGEECAYRVDSFECQCYRILLLGLKSGRKVHQGQWNMIVVQKVSEIGPV